MGSLPRLPALAVTLVSLTLTFVEPVSAGALENGGFECAAPGLTFPDGAGAWGGDFTSKVSAANGITPFEGTAMLRFDGT